MPKLRWPRLRADNCSAIGRSTRQSRDGFWRKLDLIHAGQTYLRRRGINLWLFSIYIHFLDGPDPGDDMHDHPWRFTSIVLRGGYMEEAAHVGALAGAAAHGWRVRPEVRIWKRWSLHTMGFGVAHRIIHADQGTVALVLRGRRLRRWGFWTPTGWVDEEFYDYVNRRAGMTEVGA